MGVTRLSSIAKRSGRGRETSQEEPFSPGQGPLRWRVCVEYQLKDITVGGRDEPSEQAAGLKQGEIALIPAVGLEMASSFLRTEEWEDPLAIPLAIEGRNRIVIPELGNINPVRRDDIPPSRVGYVRNNWHAAQANAQDPDVAFSKVFYESA